MLNKNSKIMFFILLAPLYFLLIMCLIGMSAGSVVWFDSAIIAILIVLASYGLSRENNILVNVVGLVLFLGIGVNLIYPTLIRTERIGPWTINIYAGTALILLGLIAFVYDIIKLTNRKNK